jgi:hypothetical protein
MKKTLLQEVKAMNKIAGTQMTKEQEIAIIRERLEQLNELEFGTQKAFDSYQKNHDLRDTTKVTVAGKKMSVSQAKDQSQDPAVKKGSTVFGKGKGGNVFGGDKKASSAPAPKLHKIYDNNDTDELVKGAKKMGLEMKPSKDGKEIEFLKKGNVVAALEKRDTEGWYGPQGSGAKNDYHVADAVGNQSAKFSMKDALKWIKDNR